MHNRLHEKWLSGQVQRKRYQEHIYIYLYVSIYIFVIFRKNEFNVYSEMESVIPNTVEDQQSGERRSINKGRFDSQLNINYTNNVTNGM